MEELIEVISFNRLFIVFNFCLKNALCFFKFLFLSGSVIQFYRRLLTKLVLPKRRKIIYVTYMRNQLCFRLTVSL